MNASPLSAQIFHDIAYKAKNRHDLLAGIDEFLDEVIVLPPGEWDPAIRIEPPKSLPSSEKRFCFKLQYHHCYIKQMFTKRLFCFSY